MAEPHVYQCDPILSNGHFLTIPREVPGRLLTSDFVFFTWPQNINPSQYTVVVEANDAASAPYRSIGPLAQNVQLPYVQFGAEAKIGVIPTADSRLPSFWSGLNRMSTYNVPEVDLRRGGQYTMTRHGKTTAGVGFTW